MENYSFTFYPDSSESSSLWDNQPPQNYKVKFMCSYGGKIHPCPHDHQLSYIGGETKILTVDRTVKFNPFISKLSTLCAGGADSNRSFKYQLLSEDLNALISVDMTRFGPSWLESAYRETKKKKSDEAPTRGKRRRSQNVASGCVKCRCSTSDAASVLHSMASPQLPLVSLS